MKNNTADKFLIGLMFLNCVAIVCLFVSMFNALGKTKSNLDRVLSPKPRGEIVLVHPTIGPIKINQKIGVI